MKPGNFENSRHFPTARIKVFSKCYRIPSHLAHAVLQTEPLFIADGDSAMPPFVVFAPLLWVTENLLRVLLQKKKKTKTKETVLTVLDQTLSNPIARFVYKEY